MKCVVEKKKKVSDKLPTVIKAVKLFLTDNDPEYPPLMGGVISESSVKQIPLQAADVLCWHLQRYYHEHNRRPFDRDDQKRMFYSLRNQNGHMEVFDKEFLRELIDAVQRLPDEESAASDEPIA